MTGRWARTRGGCGSRGRHSAALLGLTALACGVPAPEDDPWADLEAREAPTGAQSVDGALSFDGAAQYASMGTAAFPFGLAPQTISVWVKPARLDGVQSFVVLRKDFQSGVQLGMQEGIPSAWRVFGGRLFAAASEPLTVGTWHHVAYVYDGSVHRLYVDGVERGSGTVEPNNRTPTTAWLGTKDGRADSYAGDMDRVRVWSAAKSHEQILLDRTSPRAEAEANVLDLGFDEPDGLRAYDRSGRGNHATLGDGDSTWAPKRVPSSVGEVSEPQPAEP